MSATEAPPEQKRRHKWKPDDRLAKAIKAEIMARVKVWSTNDARYLDCRLFEVGRVRAAVYVKLRDDGHDVPSDRDWEQAFTAGLNTLVAEQKLVVSGLGPYRKVRLFVTKEKIDAERRRSNNRLIAAREAGVSKKKAQAGAGTKSKKKAGGKKKLAAA